MEKTHYLFVSAAGDLLPRWREAFPSARAAALDALPEPMPAMAWLRLVAGLPVAAQIALVRAHVGAAPIVVLSDVPNDDEAMQAFSAAARGYCNTHATAGLLAQVAAVVSQGGIWIGEALMQRLLLATAGVALPAPAEQRSWEAALTGREREVARAVASGASNKEIAQRLAITERTVKAHVGAILEKLGVRDRLQLAVLIRE
ncbi:MAG: LuxR C-terminal-related transcriptional regulator [Bacillota bacterium]